MTMHISGTTKVVGLFGYPVSHSLSPAMHNAAFEAMGIDYCYVTFPVNPKLVEQAVRAIPSLGLAGVNVTVPHKESVMRYLDRVDKEAAFIGAVNTIAINEKGQLVGYNTDGKGFMQSLEEEGIDVEGKRIFVIGAGGAARAICFQLCQHASEVIIYNRTLRRLQLLVADLAINYPNVVGVEDFERIAEADIVINATPMGLKSDDPLPCEAGLLKGSQIVGDLIYKETAFLKEAGRKGCRTFHGLGMLLWQGVLASELWTGQSPPHEIMRKALVRAMSEAE